jgi:hypothetical protein
MATAEDHEIVVGSTTTRLRLARDANGKPAYSVTEDIPQYNQVLEAGQTEWISGHGQYEREQSGMYFDGQSIDTTQEGRVMLGPKITEVYISNAGAKDYYITGADAYTEVTAGWWLCQTFTTSSAYTITGVKLQLWRVGSPGPLTVSIYATTAGKPSGAVLCSGTTDGNTITTAATGEWRTINFTTPVALTNTTVYAIVASAAGGDAYNYVEWMYDITAPAYAGGSYVISTNSGTTWTIDTDYDFMFETYGSSTTALASPPVKFFWSVTANLALTADSAKILYYDGTNWRAAATTVANVSDFIEYNGIIYAACGAANLWWYSTNGTNWTITDLTQGYATMFLVAPNAGATADILWAVKTPNELRYTTDGRSVADGGVQMSSPAYIGDTTSDITTPFLCGDKMKIGREDNMYEYSSDGGTIPQMDELRNARSTQNFKYVTNWQGSAYFSRGTGVGELTGYNYFSLMGPLENTGDLDKVGFCSGLAADTHYLYAAMIEETVTHIYKGKPSAGDQSIEWHWCPWVYVGANTCGTIAVIQHSPTDRRLWFGYGTVGTYHTAYVQITDNPTTDVNARFAPSGFVRMSYIYGTNPYYDKMYQTIVTETAGCAANISVTPKYRKDTETSMTALTAAITTNGVVKTALTNALTSKRIQFELDLATNNPLISPQVLTFIARGVEKPELTRIHEATYVIADSPTRRAKTDRAALRSARTSTSLIKFADLRFGDSTAGTVGTDYVNVVAMPGFPKEIDAIHVAGRAPEILVQARWQEVLS